MTESLLQYIWQFQYFNRAQLATTRGEKVEVLYPGMRNNNQGPDFLAARICIDGTVLAGSVELHLKTSDWSKHGHSADANYNNVILHVVLHHDVPDNTRLPVLELQPRISNLLLQQYKALMQQSPFIACAATISQVNNLTWQAWKERLAAERLARKAKGFLSVLEKNGNHWEETFWQLLARSFGAKINSDAFENIAQTVGVKLLAKHKNSLPQLEALLLGQAGLLPSPAPDEYTGLLLREYRFLKSKYNLQPTAMPVHFLRMRPPNFPTVRLAQLAALAYRSEHLFSKVLETSDAKEVAQWLKVTASEYWHHHYRPGEQGAYKPKTLGADMIDNIIINTLAPVLFAYGEYHRQQVHKDKAIQWLQQTGAEQNHIIKGFESVSVGSRSAFDTQALIELKNEYCHHRRCLNCAIGNALLKRCGA